LSWKKLKPNQQVQQQMRAGLQQNVELEKAQVQQVQQQ
jgi:hypothetical protein